MKAKSTARSSNNFSICQDQLYVGIVYKNSLDTQNIEAALCLRVIGRMVTFYTLVLSSTRLYVTDKTKTHSSLDDLAKLVVNIPRICRVFDTSNLICKSSVHQTLPSQHRPAIKTSSYNGIFSPSQDRKRSHN